MSRNFSGTPINLLVQKKADTSPIDFRYSAVFTDSIIDDPRLYNVAITRLQLPTSNIETLYFTDPANYKFSIRGSNGITNSVSSYSKTMPNYTGIDENSDYHGSIRYYSNEQIVDVMSRTMMCAYAKYVKSFGNSYYSETSATFLWDSTINALGATTKSTNYSVSLNIGSIAFVEFEVDELIASNTSYTYSTDSGLTKSTGNIKFTLTSPSSNSVILLNLNANEIYKPKGSTKKFIFTEASFNSSASSINDNDASQNTQFYLPAVESYLSLNSKSANGTWTLTMNSDQTTWGAMKFKLRIYNVATGQPTTPPVMSFNSSGEKLTLSYEESYVKSGLRLCFSPKLKSMFDFSPQMRWDASQQHWEFIYPPLILNAVNSMVQYSQIYTSKSMVANLSRIVVLSASLATANDLVDGPLLSSKQTLADFLIDTSSNNLDTLTFSDGASFPSTWRIYRLKTSQPIHNVDLDVQAEYSNGESKTVVIPAGSSANIRISFFPRQY